MNELLPCPFCGGEADILEASEDSFCALCIDCGVETPYQISAEEAIAAWNRRAQPENSRQHALQTGVCPMCEDCPDGCQVEAPNDSRNKPENEPIVKCGECVVPIADCPCGDVVMLKTDFCSYGKRKPERSEG